jgi:hypothetical protein
MKPKIFTTSMNRKVCWEDGYKEGKVEAKKEFEKIIDYYQKTWENDKDAMFNDGYMNNLFSELKSKLRGK